jgi:hypothetical protein
MMLSYRTPLVSLTLLLSSACGAATVEPTDTNTSWLATCGGDSDCSNEFSCLCGVCTLTCTSNSECSSASPNAVCETVEGACSDAERTCQKARDEDRSPPDGSTIAPAKDAGPNATNETITIGNTASSDAPQSDAATPESSGTSPASGSDAGGVVTCSISDSPAIDVQMVCAPGSSCCGCGCYPQPVCSDAATDTAGGLTTCAAMRKQACVPQVPNRALAESPKAPARRVYRCSKAVAQSWMEDVGPVRSSSFRRSAVRPSRKL